MGASMMHAHGANTKVLFRLSMLRYLSISMISPGVCCVRLIYAKTIVCSRHGHDTFPLYAAHENTIRVVSEGHNIIGWHHSVQIIHAIAVSKDFYFVEMFII